MSLQVPKKGEINSTYILQKNYLYQQLISNLRIVCSSNILVELLALDKVPYLESIYASIILTKYSELKNRSKPVYLPLCCILIKQEITRKSKIICFPVGQSSNFSISQNSLRYMIHISGNYILCLHIGNLYVVLQECTF